MHARAHFRLRCAPRCRSFKLQLSAAEETRLRTTMSGWHSLSCMPHWMRHGELSVALALAGALDEQVRECG